MKKLYEDISQFLKEKPEEIQEAPEVVTEDASESDLEFTKVHQLKNKPAKPAKRKITQHRERLEKIKTFKV